jgi:hypothetical protein
MSSPPTTPIKATKDIKKDKQHPSRAALSNTSSAVPGSAIASLQKRSNRVSPIEPRNAPSSILKGISEMLLRNREPRMAPTMAAIGTPIVHHRVAMRVFLREDSET